MVADSSVILISATYTGEIMKKDIEFEQLQDEAIELIKNKKGNKNMKEKKAPATYTLGQIVKSIVIVATLLAIGAFSGITIQSAINSHINTKVVEQVKSFTPAE